MSIKKQASERAMKYFVASFLATTVFYGVIHLSVLVHALGIFRRAVFGHGNNTERRLTGPSKQLQPRPIERQHRRRPPLRNALIISVAPRTVKHVVALWSELECFSTDVDYVLLSGPIWSRGILEQVTSMAKASIPRFASDNDEVVGLEYNVFVNDRYDVGLWCDALEWMERRREDDDGDSVTATTTVARGTNNHHHDHSLSSFDQVGLLNDSVFALREYSSLLSALQDYNVSMSSLNYSFQRPEGYGGDMFWVESVWRGFDKQGLATFREYSCRSADDPFFCARRWWGKKGCVVENFERNMARQYPRDKVMGLFNSDVPTDMQTRKYSFPTWVRHQPYWRHLLEKEDFPVSKVNWPAMIDSLNDERIKTCTQSLDRSVLDSFDFSVAVKAI